MAGLLCMWRLMCNRKASRRHRLMALSSLVGVGYFVLMAVAGPWTGFVFVLPALYKESFSRLLFHCLTASFLYLNVVGNYILAYSKSSALEEFYKQSNVANHQNKTAVMTVHCKRCDFGVPPRCHHCPLCDVCVLKRDHHCSFMGTCIGYRNHGYFLCFCLYTFLGTTYSCVHLLQYLTVYHDVKIDDVTDVLILGPLVIFDFISGVSRSNSFMSLVGMFYGCFGSGIAAGGFFTWHLYMITHGLITYEACRNIYTYCDPHQWKEHFLDVFGPRWYLNLLLPVSIPHHIPNYMLVWWKSKRKVNNSFDKYSASRRR